MDELFENNPTWIIGPGSRKKLAAIIKNRQHAEAVALSGENFVKSTALAIEEAEEKS